MHGFGEASTGQPYRLALLRVGDDATQHLCHRGVDHELLKLTDEAGTFGVRVQAGEF